MTQGRPKSITPGDMVYVSESCSGVLDALSGDPVDLSSTGALMYLGRVRPMEPRALVMAHGLIYEVPHSSLRRAG